MEKGQEQEDSDTFGRWPGSWQLNGSGRPLTDPLQGVGVSLAGQCHIYCPLFSVNLLFFPRRLLLLVGPMLLVLLLATPQSSAASACGSS